jgi:hypothetical protein
MALYSASLYPFRGFDLRNGYHSGTATDQFDRPLSVEDLVSIIRD